MVCKGIHDADFEYGIKFDSLTQSIEFDDVMILKTMKTEGCQYLDKTVMYAYEAKNWHVIYDDFDYGIQF